MKRGFCRTSFRPGGFTLIELLVVIAIIAVLVALILPANREYRKPLMIQCVSNLKRIVMGHHLWRLDHGERFPWEVEHAHQGEVLSQFLAVSNYVDDPGVFACPGDKSRQPAGDYAEFTRAHLSYFITTTMNTNWIAAIMSGDRNMARNGQQLEPGVAQIKKGDTVSWAPGIHGKDVESARGNLVFLDGHVEISSTNLQQLFGQTGVTTNRLLIP